MSKPERQTHYLKDYRPADFLIERVHLHFDLYQDETVVKALLAIKRNPHAQDKKATLVLNGEELTLRSIHLDGRPLESAEFHVDDTSLTIPDVPEAFTLETEVTIYPQDNTTLSGLYRSRGNFCTQCEAEGFRRITYYLDRPDVLARFTTTISADKKQYPMLLSNGNLIETKDLDEKRHWAHWEDPTLKPCYLFALVAGDFGRLTDSFTTMSGRNVELRLYIEKGYLDQADFAMASLKQAMSWDEQRYAREYELDLYMIVAVSDFNMGAMENKGLNIFNTKYVMAKPETATDFDYMNIERVVGHEYFHNWSGNRITCRDWFQITLKEGLTVFREQSFVQDRTSDAVARIDEVNVLRSRQFQEDRGPMAHPIRPDSYIEINNFYTVTVYNKGAEVIRMVQTLLTPAVFRQAMDEYFSRYDGQAVTTDDFIQVMEDISQRDLTQFRRWYAQAGTPRLQVAGDYNEAKKTFTLTVKQSCPATPGQPRKEPFHLPLSMSLLKEDCEPIPLRLLDEKHAVSDSRVLEIHKAEQTFTFVNVPEKPIPSLLHHFSAPVELAYPYTPTELAHLWKCDHDAFARWDAGQRLSTDILLQLADAARQGMPLKMEPLLVEVFTELLKAEHDDFSLLTRLLMLPKEDYLLPRMPVVDIDALHQARQFVLHELAQLLEQHFLVQYELHHHKEAYQYNQQDMGKRSFKNLCLSYLLYNDNADYAGVAYQQFSDTDNMTDSMGALVALNHHDIPERRQALDEFYTRWEKEILVVDKWLLLQASSYLPDTLDHVQALMKHPGFHFHNPNSVYSLICGFGNNTVRFHDSRAAGYEFIADQVLAIDADNPQVAARVLQPLIHWKQMNETSATQMQTALNRIAASPDLSSDVFEIVEKSRLG